MININNSPSLGVFSSVNISDEHSIELQYHFFPTKIELFPRDKTQRQYEIMLATMHYLLLGSRYNYEFNPNDIGFLFGGLGFVVGVPSSTKYFPITEFAVSGEAGFIHTFNERLGIRVQASIMFPMQFWGADFIFGGGTAVGVNGVALMVQFNMSAGIYYRL